ncbi:MAG: hypothetical protein K2X67_09275 [Burkholderiales bacterium]|nr:hypothetical protein [Burkholderiales bacterium]
MHSSSLRLLLSRIVLAAALLFAQQVGVAHAVAHGAGNAPTHQHGKGVPMQGCDECVAFAQVQGGPGSFLVHTPPSADYVVPRFESRDDWHPAPTRAFSSRAPPLHT